MKKLLDIRQLKMVTRWRPGMAYETIVRSPKGGHIYSDSRIVVTFKDAADEEKLAAVEEAVGGKLHGHYGSTYTFVRESSSYDELMQLAERVSELEFVSEAHLDEVRNPQFSPISKIR